MEKREHKRTSPTIRLFDKSHSQDTRREDHTRTRTKENNRNRIKSNASATIKRHGRIGFDLRGGSSGQAKSPHETSTTPAPQKEEARGARLTCNDLKKGTKERKKFSTFKNSEGLKCGRRIRTRSVRICWETDHGQHRKIKDKKGDRAGNENSAQRPTVPKKQQKEADGLSSETVQGQWEKEGQKNNNPTKGGQGRKLQSH